MRKMTYAHDDTLPYSYLRHKNTRFVQPRKKVTSISGNQSPFPKKTVIECTTSLTSNLRPRPNINFSLLFSYHILNRNRHNGQTYRG